MGLSTDRGFRRSVCGRIGRISGHLPPEHLDLRQTAISATASPAGLGAVNCIDLKIRAAISESNCPRTTTVIVAKHQLEELRSKGRYLEREREQLDSGHVSAAMMDAFHVIGAPPVREAVSRLRLHEDDIHCTALAAKSQELFTDLSQYNKPTFWLGMHQQAGYRWYQVCYQWWSRSLAQMILPKICKCRIQSVLHKSIHPIPGWHRTWL